MVGFLLLSYLNDNKLWAGKAIEKCERDYLLICELLTKLLSNSLTFVRYVTTNLSPAKEIWSVTQIVIQDQNVIPPLFFGFLCSKLSYSTAHSCPHPGCGKSFVRKFILKQHVDRNHTWRSIQLLCTLWCSICIFCHELEDAPLHQCVFRNSNCTRN